MYKYLKNINNLEELKKQYKKLAFKHHPDKGGNVETMKQINNEYDALFKTLKTDSNKELQEDFKEIIDKIININNIDIEIIGTWVWVSGNTIIVKDKLKDAGFKWANKKCMWYWRSEENAVKRKSSMTIEEIRSRYGSEKIKNSCKYALAN